MSPLPPSTFADRLRALDRPALAAFVADLWAASGWETEVEGTVVVARRDGQERRLLVLPARRLDRWRSAPAVDEPVDEVVVARRIDGREGLPRGTPDAPVLDADDLRRRLCYGVDPEAGDALCRDALGVPLRDQRWAGDGRSGPIRAVVGGRALAAGAALALALVAVLALAVAGGPLFESIESAPASASERAVAEGAGERTEVEAAGNQAVVSAAEGVAQGPTVYVGSHRGSIEGTVYAVDAATGERAWAFDDPDGGIYSSPTAVNGTVYVGSVDGTLYAVDADTGRQRWAFDGAEGPIWSSPTVVNDTVYVGSDDGTVYAVDADSGLSEWSYEAANLGVFASPTVVDGTVYVGTITAELHAVDAETGEREWLFDGPNRSVLSSPTVHEGTVYAGTNAGRLYAVDAETGEREWVHEAGSPVFASPTVAPADGTAAVYAASENGTVFALDAATGDPVWTVGPLPGSIAASVTVANVSGGPTAYAVTDDGTAYALAAADGTVAWTADVGAGTERSTPTVAAVGGRPTLFVGSADARLFALDAATGERVWTFDDPEHVVATGPTVVADPVEGDSVDSRVRQRTLGHHDQSAESGPQGAPEFRIVALRGPPTTDAGGRTRLEATVVNAGGAGNGTVAWTVDGERADAVEVALDAGESATVELSMAVPEAGGEVTYGVRTPSDEASGTTTALAPPTFEAVEVEAPAEVRPGEAVEVDLRIANEGNRTGTTTVALAVDGTVVDRTEVEVEDGAVETVTLSFTPEAPGERTYAVTTGDDRRTGTIAVAGPDELPGFGLVAVAAAAALAAVALRRRG